MANGNYVQTSFLGGEWSPLAQGRMDDPRYKTALATCLNSLPLEEGAWTRRPGLRRIGYTRGGAEAKIIPFEASEAASYNLALSAGHAWVTSGANLICDQESDITDIQDLSGSARVFAANTWAAGDYVVIRFLTEAGKAGVPRLANRIFKLATCTSTQFTIADALTGTNIDFASIGTFPGTGHLVAARVLDLTTPYTGTLFRDVKPVQSEEDCILLQGRTKPQVVTFGSGDNETAAFSITPSAFLDGPYLDAFPGSLATPSGTTGVISITLSFTAYSATKAYKKGDYVKSVGIGYKSLLDNNVNHTPASNPTYWQVVSFGDPVGPSGFAASDIGRLVRLFSAGTTWTWGRVVGNSTTGFIDPSARTKIGDMTDGGGLAALFDGDISKLPSECGYEHNTTNCWAGLTIGGGGSTLRSVTLYPATTALDDEKWVDTTLSKVNVELYAKTGAAPTGPTDGTLLGSVLAPNTPGEAFTITSSDVATTFAHVWVRMYASGNSKDLGAAQFQFFNASGAPGVAVDVEILGADLASSADCVWRLGAYSDTTGWPTCGCYTEGRLWLGGAIPNRFDASNSNDIYNFAPTAAGGAVGDANAISYTVNANDVNPIFWMEPNAQGIVMGTQGGEWLVSSTSETNNMTPTTTKARRVTKYKCADALPVTIGVSTVFIQKAKRNVLEFISDIFSGKFFAPNLNELARHMTAGNLEEICGQDGMTPVVWGRREDGKLVGATYKRVSMHSSEPPKFLGWHRHELGMAGHTITSITRSSLDDAGVEGLSMVTVDANGLYHMYQMSQVFDEDFEITDAMFLDNAIVPIAASTSTIDGVENLNLHGLMDFEGLTVSAFAGGVDCGSNFRVVGGTISIPLTGLLDRDRMTDLSSGDYGDMAVAVNSGEFTIPAVVGFSYTSDAQQLRPFRMEDTGARAGVAFGKTKRSHKHAMLLHKTQGLSVGTDFTKLRPARFRTPGQVDYALTQLYSGIIKDMLDDTYSLDSMVCWRISRPYPATVCASGAFLATQDE